MSVNDVNSIFNRLDILLLCFPFSDLEYVNTGWKEGYKANPISMKLLSSLLN